MLKNPSRSWFRHSRERGKLCFPRLFPGTRFRVHDGFLPAGLFFITLAAHLILTAAVSVGGLCLSTSAAAAVLDLTAENLFVHPGGNEFDATGTVRVESGDLVLRGDHLRYDPETDILRAEGGVVVIRPEGEFHTEYLEVDLGDRTGWAQEGYLVRKEDFLRVDAEKFVGEPTRIRLEGCRISTCRGSSPDWSIGADRASTPPSGLVRARGATFRIKDVPVIYAPLFWYPALDVRRTGLLIPTVGFGDRDGFRYFQPFYWLLAPNRDLTVTAEYRSRRGLGVETEFRGLFGDFASGRLRVRFLPDRLSERNFVETQGGLEYAPHPAARAYFRGRHLSEPDFYREFSRSFENRILRSLESVAHGSYQGETTRWFATLRARQNLNGPSDDLPASVHAGSRTLLVPGSPGFMTDALARFDLTVGTHQRERGADTGSIRGTTRLHLPLSLGPITADTGFGGRIEIADRGGQRDPRQNDIGAAAEAWLEIGSRLGRRYGGWNHVIEPRLRYDHRVRGGDFLDETTDEEAALTTRQVSAVLGNRFFMEGRQVGVFEISAGADLARDEALWEFIRAEGSLTTPFQLSVRTDYDPNDHRLRLVSTGITVPVFRGTASLVHRYDRTDTSEAPAQATVIGLSQKLSDTFGVSLSAWYDEEGGGLRQLLGKVSWIRDCWGLGISYVHQLDETRFLVSVFLRGLGYLGSSAAFPAIP